MLEAEAHEESTPTRTPLGADQDSSQYEDVAMEEQQILEQRVAECCSCHEEIGKEFKKELAWMAGFASNVRAQSPTTGGESGCCALQSRQNKPNISDLLESNKLLSSAQKTSRGQGRLRQVQDSELDRRIPRGGSGVDTALNQSS